MIAETGFAFFSHCNSIQVGLRLQCVMFCCNFNPWSLYGVLNRLEKCLVPAAPGSLLFMHVFCFPIHNFSMGIICFRILLEQLGFSLMWQWPSVLFVIHVCTWVVKNLSFDYALALCNLLCRKHGRCFLNLCIFFSIYFLVWNHAILIRVCFDDIWINRCKFLLLVFYVSDKHLYNFTVV